MRGRDDYPVFHIPSSVLAARDDNEEIVIEETAGRGNLRRSISEESLSSEICFLESDETQRHLTAMELRDAFDENRRLKSQVDEYQHIVDQLSTDLANRDKTISALRSAIDRLQNAPAPSPSTFGIQAAPAPSSPRARTTPRPQSRTASCLAASPVFPSHSQLRSTTSPGTPSRSRSRAHLSDVSSVSSFAISETDTFGGRLKSPGLSFPAPSTSAAAFADASLTALAGIAPLWKSTLQELLHQEPSCWRRELQLRLASSDVDAAIRALTQQRSADNEEGRAGESLLSEEDDGYIVHHKSTYY